MKNISILSPYHKRNNYQFFLKWFNQAFLKVGIKETKGVFIPWLLRLIVAKFRISRNIPAITNSQKALLILGTGYIDSFAWPFAYKMEIIPVLWDTWPRYWKRLIASLKRHNVKFAFFTQSQVARMVEYEIPGIKCYHIIEGINPLGYDPGDELTNRTIDLLELGRVYSHFNDIIVNDKPASLKVHLYKNPKEGLLFPDFTTLAEGLSKSKITVCFPRCDTHPEQTGDVETMTQRYWECMLSRTIILGRAPKELIDFAGYNPVVDIDWDNPSSQIDRILCNLQDHQGLVDENYRFALENAPWDSRVENMLNILKKEGYYI